jgi:uncharacterized Fe-S cluster-containing radical SAM superfamily protein
MGNMYNDSVRVSNVMVGCEWKCVYCRVSFQAQMKRQLQNCKLCHAYEPHFHEERLKQSLPKTEGDEFIWLIRSGDPCFMKLTDFRKVLNLMKKRSDRTFLIQTKDPSFFYDFIFPNNVILGITLETDIDKDYDKISKAPAPSIRVNDFRVYEHSRKCVTIEPILQFNMDRMINYIEAINPERIYIGYNSKPKQIQLPEPSLFKTRLLITNLERLGFKVKKKNYRVYSRKSKER